MINLAPIQTSTTWWKDFGFPRAEVTYFPDWQGGGVDIYNWQAQWQNWARQYGHPAIGYVENAEDLSMWLNFVQRVAQAQVEQEGLDPLLAQRGLDLAWVSKEWYDAHPQAGPDPFHEAGRLTAIATENMSDPTITRVWGEVVDINPDPLVQDIRFRNDPVVTEMGEVPPLMTFNNDPTIHDPPTSYETESGMITTTGGNTRSLLDPTTDVLELGTGNGGPGGGVEISTGTFLGLVLIGVAVWYAHRQGWF